MKKHGSHYGSGRKERKMTLKDWMEKQGWTPCEILKNRNGGEIAHWENEDEFANVRYDGKTFDVQHHMKSEDGLEYLDYRD